MASEVRVFPKGLGFTGVVEFEVVPHDVVEKLATDDELKEDKLDDVDCTAEEFKPNPPFPVNL